VTDEYVHDHPWQAGSAIAAGPSASCFGLLIGRR